MDSEACLRFVIAGRIVCAEAIPRLPMKRWFRLRSQ